MFTSYLQLVNYKCKRFIKLSPVLKNMIVIKPKRALSEIQTGKLELPTQEYLQVCRIN